MDIAPVQASTVAVVYPFVALTVVVVPAVLCFGVGHHNRSPCLVPFEAEN